MEMKRASIRFGGICVLAAMLLSLFACQVEQTHSLLPYANSKPPSIERVVEATAVETSVSNAAPHQEQAQAPIRIELIQPETQAEPFVFAWMSDTQLYSESYPTTFRTMTQWLIENREQEQIVYLFHTGDIVNDWRRDVEWDNAEEAIAPLFETLPFGVLAGNHDIGTKAKDFTRYQKQFGEERFRDRPCYGGSYQDNRGHYDLISAGGMDFIMLYMSWAIDDEAIAWMNEVLAAHRDRIAFLALHEYMNATGSRTTIGEKLFHEVVETNPNVYFVLCGHRHGAARRLSDVDDDGDGKPDRVVAQMLSNYQGETDGGEGFLRLMRFDPAADEIHIRTYSPLLDEENCIDGEDEFTLPLLGPHTKS